MSPGRALLLGAGAALAYGLGVRRRVLEWGATRPEAAARLPGDELLENPDGVSTRAITIAAAPGAVWPWLVQMGPRPRAGAYTYDWIERLLGLDMRSSEEILPEFQYPRLGDTIAFGSNTMRLDLLEPPRALAFRSQDGNWLWSFNLRDVPEGTRLISRNRYRLPSPAAKLGMLALEPGSLVMERRMLQGLRERAERTPPPAVAAGSRAGAEVPPASSG